MRRIVERETVALSLDIEVGKSLVLMLASAWLSACSLSPGLHLSDGDFDGKQEPAADEKAVPELEVKLIPLTAGVVQKQALLARGIKPVAGKTAKYEYLVGPQDVLSIVVWEHPELTIPAGEQRPVEKAGHRVNSNGEIFYPYVGMVKVSGKSPDTIRKELTKKLSRYIKRPQLDVRVVDFNSQKVYVSGQVKKPGNMPITDVPVYVTDAINTGGGTTENADTSRVVLTRNGVKTTLNLVALYSYGDASQNWLLQGGDILYIPENHSNKIYVMGEVKKPAALPLADGRMTLAEAISTGGVDQNAAHPGKIYVLRRQGDKAVAYRLDAGEPDALILATAFQLQPLDIVFVSTAGVSRWNRVMSQLLPTAQTLWTVDLINEGTQ